MPAEVGLQGTEQNLKRTHTVTPLISFNRKSGVDYSRHNAIIRGPGASHVCTADHLCWLLPADGPLVATPAVVLTHPL